MEPLVSKVDLAVIGDALIDVCTLHKHLVPGQANKTNIVVSPGGLGNTAVWASKRGCETAFIGKVGKDLFAEFYEQDLKKYGVHPH